MILRTLLCFLALYPTASTSFAQFTEGFDDFDFLSNPVWTGDTDHWRLGQLNGHALQSNGAALADTIHLAAENAVAHGTWRFTFAHQGINLSSFNGGRIFLISDRSDPRENAVGYYLQIGTNNSDVLSLWRSDGSLSTQRVELGRSNTPLAPGDSSLLHIVVERDAFGLFRVYSDEALVISARDDRYATSAYFVFWIKHSAKGGEAFLFDDISIEELKSSENDGPFPESGDIVINEVYFDPHPGESEFIEVYNTTEAAFDLRRIGMRDARADAVAVTLTPKLLNPGAFIVLVQDSAAFSSAVAGIPAIAVDGWPSLNNGGDHVALIGPSGILDSLTYTGPSPGRSLERIDPLAPSEAYNFGTSLSASGSTPGRVNSIFAIDDRPPFIRFAEQVDDAAIDIHFDEPVRMAELTPSDVTYDAGIVELSPLTPSSIRVRLDRLSVASHLAIDGVEDRKGNRADRLTHPIAFLPRRGDLAINEIMYQPLADAYDGRPDQVEFVELVSTSEKLLALTAFFRTRNVDETGDADTLRAGRPFAALRPGAHFVLSNEDSTVVRNAFGTMSADPNAVFQSAAGLSLANGGDRIRFHNRTGEIIDEAVYHPSWHHPDLSQHRGFSLERIDVGADVHDAANWTSSTAVDGATPGAANSVAYAASSPRSEYGITIDPSPFSPDGDGHEDAAVISYRVRSAAPTIRVRIFDVDGFEVRALVPAQLSAQEGRIVWDGRDHADRSLRIGIYIVVFEAVDPDSRNAEVFKRPVVIARRF